MSIESIKAQYVDPEQVHEVISLTPDSCLNITDAGRTLLATVKSSTSVVTVIGDAHLFSFFDGAAAFSSSEGESAIFGKATGSQFFFFCPPRCEAVAAVIPVSDVVVTAESVALFDQVLRLTGHSPEPSDMPALVLSKSSVFTTSALRQLFPSHRTVCEHESELVDKVLHSPGKKFRANLLLMLDKVLHSLNGKSTVAAASLFSLARTTQQAALDKAAFWTTKVLAREKRRVLESLPLDESEIARASESLRTVAMAEWKKWTDEEGPEFSLDAEIEELKRLNTAASKSANESVMAGFQEKLQHTSRPDLLQVYSETLVKLKGEGKEDLVKAMCAFADEEIAALKEERVSLLARMQDEAVRSTSIMEAAQQKITQLVMKDEENKKLIETLEERDEYNKAVIERLTNQVDELKAVIDRHTTTASKEDQELKHLKQYDEYEKTILALEAQLAETRLALDDERTVKLHNKLDLPPKHNRSSIFGCFATKSN